MVVVEGSVKLGFVVGTHDLRKEMALVAGSDTLMSGSGYVSCGANTDLKQVLTRGWIAPPSRSLVIWKSGVVHFEATSGPRGLFQSFQDSANQERLRIVVGTHVPVGLSREDLIQIAVMAERGVIPDFYRKINKVLGGFKSFLCDGWGVVPHFS